MQINRRFFSISASRSYEHLLALLFSTISLLLKIIIIIAIFISFMIIIRVAGIVIAINILKVMWRNIFYYNIISNTGANRMAHKTSYRLIISLQLYIRVEYWFFKLCMSKFCILQKLLDVIS